MQCEQTIISAFDRSEHVQASDLEYRRMGSQHLPSEPRASHVSSSSSREDGGWWQHAGGATSETPGRQEVHQRLEKDDLGYHEDVVYGAGSVDREFPGGAQRKPSRPTAASDNVIEHDYKPQEGSQGTVEPRHRESSQEVHGSQEVSGSHGEVPAPGRLVEVQGQRVDEMVDVHSMWCEVESPARGCEPRVGEESRGSDGERRSLQDSTAQRVEYPKYLPPPRGRLDQGAREVQLDHLGRPMTNLENDKPASSSSTGPTTTRKFRQLREFGRPREDCGHDKEARQRASATRSRPSS